MATGGGISGGNLMRRLLFAGLLCSAALASGCRYCASCYDYCGPVMCGPCGNNCDVLHRHNSVLSGGGYDYDESLPWEGDYEYVEPEPEMVPRPRIADPQPTPAPMPPGPTARRGYPTHAQAHYYY